MSTLLLQSKNVFLLTIASLTIAGASALPADEILPPKKDITSAMALANHYFVAKWPSAGCNDCLPKKRPSNIWTRAVYFEGAMALYRISKDPEILKYAEDWGTFHDWSLHKGDTTENPDDQCAGQSYLELYLLDPAKTERLSHLRANIDNWTNSPKLDYYAWIDTFQMSMRNFAELGVIDKKTAYPDKMYALFDHTKTGLGLYNPEDHLWWRDVKFKPPFATPNGKKCYWSRGNGWVVAAMARVLEVLPGSDPHYAEYLKVLTEMSAALLPLQREDGFWNVSLADANDYGGQETTGTALFTCGLAWGVRSGHLPAETYLPCIGKAWNAISHKALHPNGFLGYVQGTGDKPASSQPVTYDSVPDNEDFGLGCFLLAGSEVYALAEARSGGSAAVQAEAAKHADQ